MIIDILLVICGTINLVLLHEFLKKDRDNVSYRRLVLTMGIAVAGWCYAYAMMGFVISFRLAGYWRAIGLVGVNVYMICEVFFMADQIRVTRNRKTIIRIVFTILMFCDLLFYTRDSVCTYVRVGDRTTFFAVDTWERSYHNLYILSLFAFLLSLWLIWKRTVHFQREVHYQNLILIVNIILMMGSLPDVFLPEWGFPSVPTSALGATLSFAFFLYVAERYNAFHITSDNICKFIYQFAEYGLMAFNLEHHLVVANPCALNWAGTADARGRQSMSMLFDMTKEEEQEYYERALNGEEQRIKVVAKRTGLVCEVRLNVARDESDYPYCFICMVYNLSREEKMMEQLHDADRAKGEFLSEMSHEIRTPINALLGMNEMILREESDESIREYAMNVDSSCQLLLSIINDILDFSKIESGQLELVENNYQLGSLIKDLLNMIKDRADKKGLTIKLDVNPQIPKGLIGDEMRVRQIITNLLTNAVKYTDYGTVTLKIDMISQSEEKVLLRVDVIDTGRGIRREDQKTLFEEFKRVDVIQNRHIEGTGLGLSIANHFVRMMNGIIGVDSDYGKGSDFWIILNQGVSLQEPIGDVMSIQKKVRGNHKNYTGHLQAPSARILYADDNATNLQVFTLLLKNTGIQIDTVDGGEAALERLRADSYDVVFLDHMMPHVDGIQVLKTMKSEKLQEAVPVIALTANAVAGARDMYLECGFTDYLSKPINGERLEHILFEYLPGDKIQSMEVQV